MKQLNKYEVPQMEILTFDDEDIVTSSDPHAKAENEMDIFGKNDI